MPGPEIIGNFDPAHYIPGSSQAVLLPGEQAVVRWLPSDPRLRTQLVLDRGPLNDENLLNMADEAQDHFALLKNCGVPVLAHRSFTGTDPFNANRRVLYTTAAYLPEEKPIGGHPEGLLVIGGVVQYLERVRAAGIPRVLDDIYSAKQFWRSKRLHDIDQLLSKSYLPYRLFTMQLRSWLASIPGESSGRAELSSKITKLND